jgi:hypothetical protein
MSLLRLTPAAALLVALTACGGGGSGLGGIIGLNPGPGPVCNAGTQVQLANPQPGQTGVSPNISQITIVANGNSNLLYNSYNQWYLTLTNQFGQSIPGGNLTLVSDQNGPHPYSSDFYYASSIPQLQQGATWQVNLTDRTGTGGTCPLNSFST